jgi:hypothetical protein
MKTSTEQRSALKQLYEFYALLSAVTAMKLDLRQQLCACWHKAQFDRQPNGCCALLNRGLKKFAEARK